MALEDIVAAHYRRSALTTRQVVAAILAIWRATGPSGFRDELQRAAGLLAFGQLTQALRAAQYLTDLADEYGMDRAPTRLVARSFAGTSADDRPLVDVLSYASRRAWAMLDAGADYAIANTSGAASLTRIVANETTQAGINAESVGMVAQPEMVGYVRLLNTPSCGRCAILAGKWFKWNDGFARHPTCFPAGVTVSGPSAEAATRRWYEGELVVIRTAGGKELPATANHPVLTDRGWLPAHFLQVGDKVVGSTNAQGAVPLVVPHEQQMPTGIEDAFRSFNMNGLLQMPTAAEDFHGDGGHGEVDVVSADGLLRDRRQSTFAQAIDQILLASRPNLALSLSGGSGFAPLGFGGLAPTSGFIGGGGLGGALHGGHSGGANLSSIGHAADGYARVGQALADHLSGDAVAEAELVLALAGLVRRRDVGDGQLDISSRWDAPAAAFSVESRGAYADRGQDLALRLSSQVKLDRVVEVRRVSWSGHVFNLTSSEGWYSANGIIVSNCDCKHVPAADAAGVTDVRVNPRDYFDALSPAEQDHYFGPGEAAAIRGGADLQTTVNLTTVKKRRSAGLLVPRSIDRLIAGKSRDEAIDVLARTGYLAA